jgi:hypothetical protein
MKFTVAALLATLTTACFAQRAIIVNETSVTPGSKQVVQIIQTVSVYLHYLLVNPTDINFLGLAVELRGGRYCDWDITVQH